VDDPIGVSMDSFAVSNGVLVLYIHDFCTLHLLIRPEEFHTGSAGLN